MMKKCTLLLMTLLCFGAMAQNKNVLFIGNSYTDVNNLPQLVGRVCESMGTPITYSSNTPGGCTFSQHCTNQSMTLIRQGGWDVVVLQEQSQYPSFPQSQVENEVFPYATQLVDSIYANSPCAEPMFYMTWGRENGDQQNAQYFPVLGTYEGMDSMLYERYMYMAQTNDASVSPVGRVWRYLRTNSPDIQLYAGDGSHPSMAGSYAAACAFYVMLFQGNPNMISFNADLDPETAQTIRNAVKVVVYDNLSFWQRPTPVANFSWTADGGTLRITNTSQHCNDYLWIWGDGSSSEGNQTSHHYQQAGSYDVTLIAGRHCMSDTSFQQVTVSEGGEVSISSVESKLQLFPNPTTGMLQIQADNFIMAQLTDCSGKVVLTSTNRQLNLSTLPQGLYLVRILTDNGTYTEKVVKQ